jgi:hypothetical protein
MDSIMESGGFGKRRLGHEIAVGNEGGEVACA